MRKRGRTDRHQPEVVKRLRAEGWSVLITSNLGSGAPDFFRAKDGKTEAIELKESTGKLTTDELHWLTEWKGECDVWFCYDNGLVVDWEGKVIMEAKK